MTDVSGHETRANPGGGGLDSNPTTMVRTRRGYVTTCAVCPGGGQVVRIAVR